MRMTVSLRTTSITPSIPAVRSLLIIMRMQLLSMKLVPSHLSCKEIKHQVMLAHRNWNVHGGCGRIPQQALCFWPYTWRNVWIAISWSAMKVNILLAHWQQGSMRLGASFLHPLFIFLIYFAFSCYSFFYGGHQVKKCKSKSNNNPKKRRTKQ